MYSDVIESPSKDCFSINDQSLSYDMAEMNEISNQNNLDYIFDSYYSSVSRYNTDFELPEDCKNMSFSELFDQELFSSQENKDCKITIKIEKEEEESLQPCYSTVNTQDTTDSRPLIQIEENVPSSSLAKRFAPKRGINRTSIKTTNNCDVQRLIYNPFCETEDLSIDQPLAKIKMPIVKREPEDVNETVEQNIVGMEIKSLYSDNSQNTANDLSFAKVEDDNLSSLSKSSTIKRQGIKRTFIKKNRKSDVQQLMYNPFCETEDLIIDRPSAKIKLPTVKCVPEDVSDTVEQNIVCMEIKPSYSDNLENTANGLSFVKVESNSLPSSKSSTIKRQGIKRTFIKKNQKSDIQQLMYNPFCETEDLIIDKSLMKFQIPIIKQEPEDVSDIVEQCIVDTKIKPGYSDDLQNKSSQSLVIIKENCSSSLSSNSTTKHQHVTNTSEYCNIDHLLRCKTSESLGIGQTSAVVSVPILKCEPEKVGAAVKQNKVKIEPYSDNSQNTTNSHSFVNIEDNILSSSSNNLVAPKQLIINGTFVEKIKNCNVNQLVNDPFCETQNTGIDQISAKVEFPIVKCEPESVDNTIEQNIVEMDIETEDESRNEFGCINLSNTIIENEVIIKKEDLPSNGIPLKNDCVYSQTFKTNNPMTLETEKKKISWEEYRAKREKLGHIDVFENKKDASAMNFDEVDNKKLEAIIKEFDRNTAEHFIREKRKIEKQNIAALGVSNVDDQELEKKRMKIEYIKKLLPSSFASEIAKTSSLMKGNLVEEIENESTSDDSVLSGDKMYAIKQTDMYGDLVYLKKDDKSQKKGHLSKIHSSRRSLRSDYNSNKGSRSSSTSSSNHDDYYNRNRVDAVQHGGQYGQNVRNNTVPRSKEQKTVVYVGQIPIRFGKRYLYNRFKEFGKIQSLTLHKKPDFRVYYAFVTYSQKSEAERAISHGNHDQNQVQFDIRFGERKQTLTPYYDLDDEWLTDWYGYNNQHSAVVRKPQSSERNVSFEEELQEFYKLAQIKKLNQIKSSQVS